MSPRRRALLLQLAAAAGGAGLGSGAAAADAAGAGAAATDAAGAGGLAAHAAGAARKPVQRGRPLEFPRDHGAHLEARTEWWYATGWLGDEEAPQGRSLTGFQVTFFRSRGVAGGSGRFAAPQLLFAHAALTELESGSHPHAQRIQRWNGREDDPLGHADTRRGAVRLHPWWMQDTGRAWATRIEARDFSLELELQRTQPLLLQGEAGFSRKGPGEAQASHYYSEVQLLPGGRTRIGARTRNWRQGRAWMDHEWSEELMHPEAVGWDWIGMNLFDGGALTAFRLRRRDGSALWAGGSFRRRGGEAASFAPDAVVMSPLQSWQSPASAARYPVRWAVESPAGRFGVRALLEAQELDSRASTGAIYWEGLSELLDADGRRIGLGYLEMTGYASPLRL